ncbi:MAG TPA: ABC transporter substrate-binding protein [Stellaceae bacterium]|nr:ABC transporter substrate-binding protein [Stellaceae bacterium]
MTTLSRRDVLAMTAAAAATGVSGRALAAAPSGQLTWAVHVSLSPTWFDPADTQALITPFMVLYALHDGVVKPMPGKLYTPSLAESWTVSEDSLTYEFVLRDGVKFHNGDPVTAEDVKFSFERYRGASDKLMKDRVASIETPDPRHVRFKLKNPWPDFLTFYSTASGAGWVVPKKYVEKVGDDGFRKHPIGAGPYKFVSYNPGVELVLEANENYWRKVPAVKRVVMKVITDETTRLASLKAGEVDIAYSIRGELAEELQKMPELTLKGVVTQASNWIYFPEQWDPKSPWHDVRVRQAANLALDRDGMNKALFLGFCKITNSIVPDTYEHYWQPPPAVFDRDKAKKLLAEAGFPNGFDAGTFWCDASYSNIGEVALDQFAQVGIRAKLNPVERAGFLTAFGGKQYTKGILRAASGAFGNAATRLASFTIKGGAYVYGSYPDIDELYPQQAVELDPKKRSAILEKMQRMVYEKSVYAPLWLLAFLNGVGPRVGESSFGKIAGMPYTAPFEDITLKA